MSVSDKFRKRWIAKFPGEVIPENLEFLRRPKDIHTLETCLDECLNLTFQLKAELEHQQLISEFILELMDDAKNVPDQADGGGSETAELGGGLSRSRSSGEKTPVAFDSDSNKRFKDCDVSSYDVIDYDDETRTYSFESPLPRRPGAFKGLLDRMKSTTVVRTTSEPNIADSKSDRSSRSSGALPQNHFRGMVSTGHSSFLNLSTRESLNSTSDLLSEQLKDEPSVGKRECSGIAEQTLTESSGKELAPEDPTEPRSISLPLLMTAGITGNLSPGKEPEVRPQRQRRQDLYEEAIPFVKNLKAEYGETVLSDEENEEENKHIYYSIILFKQQTLERAKMLYCNEEEEPVKKLERQARKLSLRYNQAEKRHANGWYRSDII